MFATFDAMIAASLCAATITETGSPEAGEAGGEVGRERPARSARDTRRRPR